jgi:hypothetical protein
MVREIKRVKLLDQQSQIDRLCWLYQYLKLLLHEQ